MTAYPDWHNMYHSFHVTYWPMLKLPLMLVRQTTETESSPGSDSTYSANWPLLAVNWQCGKAVTCMDEIQEELNFPLFVVLKCRPVNFPLNNLIIYLTR